MLLSSLIGLHPQVVGEDGFSVISNGLPIRAHSIRRLKGEDLLRVDGELPMILENNISSKGESFFNFPFSTFVSTFEDQRKLNAPTPSRDRTHGPHFLRLGMMKNTLGITWTDRGGGLLRKKRAKHSKTMIINVGEHVFPNILERKIVIFFPNIFFSPSELTYYRGIRKIRRRWLVPTYRCMAIPSLPPAGPIGAGKNGVGKLLTKWKMGGKWGETANMKMENGNGTCANFDSISIFIQAIW